MERIGQDAQEEKGRDRGRKGNKETTRRSSQNDERQIQRADGINYDQVITDSARYLKVHDVDLIMSWTPHEYLLLLKGAQHSIIDEYEKMAKSAMAIGYASQSKRPKEKRIFNAERQRRKLETGQDYDLEEMKKSARQNRALQGFKPNFIPKKKGG